MSLWNGRIVFILGCTGAGKSDLAVRIALKHNGEVVNADALQLYEGLDVATNKITKEEMMGVPHHMLGILPPKTKRFHVQAFRNRALQVIAELHSRNKLPVVVGGTAYYVESLLYTNNFVSTRGEADVDDPEEDDAELVEEMKGGILSDLSGMTNETIHAVLQEVDPDSARSIHPNNRKRVLRAIEIFRVAGERKSAILDGRRERGEAGDYGGRLRYPEALLLLLDAPKEYSSSVLANPHGIAASIGLKEFIPFLNLSDEERAGEQGEALFQQGTSQVQLHTRQYARRQRNWINSRFLRATGNREVFEEDYGSRKDS